MTHRVHRADGDCRDRPAAISAPLRYRARRAADPGAATSTDHIGRSAGASGRAG